MIKRLEDSLNGGYKGLYGEVVTEDCYRLRRLKIEPDVIFDIGANVGIFARFARSLFPNALIVCLEPDPENVKVLKRFTKDEGLILIERALGRGQIYHGLTARNGSGETYLSTGLGYPEPLMQKDPRVERSRIPGISLAEFTRPFWKDEGIHILKMDCEGAENSVWNNRESMDCFRRMDYVAAEVHDYAIDGSQMPEVLAKTAGALKSLESTHRCEREGVHFWALRRMLC